MVTALLGAGALLLLAAGASKAVDPSRTAGAMRAMALPATPTAIRVAAVVEAVVGASALVLGGAVPALLVALSYGAFTLFVLAALRAGTPIGTCGCFARADTPPRVSHVLVDGTLALGALVAALSTGTEPLVTAPLPDAAAGIAVAALAYLALTRGGAGTSPPARPGTTSLRS